MDNVLYASMDILDVVECNMPYVCENASMSVYPNVKLLKKNANYFHENLSKFIYENDDLISKLNESNKLV